MISLYLKWKWRASFCSLYAYSKSCFHYVVILMLPQRMIQWENTEVARCCLCCVGWLINRSLHRTQQSSRWQDTLQGGRWRVCWSRDTGEGQRVLCLRERGGMMETESWRMVQGSEERGRAGWGGRRGWGGGAVLKGSPHQETYRS